MPIALFYRFHPKLRFATVHGFKQLQLPAFFAKQLDLHPLWRRVAKLSYRWRFAVQVLCVGLTNSRVKEMSKARAEHSWFGCW